MHGNLSEEQDTYRACVDKIPWEHHTAPFWLGTHTALL